MKDNRPVNLDLGTIHFPVAALSSITHRITGVILLVGVGILLWLFDQSLSGEEGFNRVREMMSSPLAKIIVWGVLAALAYHTVAGFRHLLMDVGIGESKAGGSTGATTTFVVSIVLIIALGVWIW